MTLRSHHVQGALAGIGLILGLLVAGFVAGAWVLSRGPVSLSMLVPRIETALTDAARSAGLPAIVQVDDVGLFWSGLERGLDLRLQGVTLTRPDGSGMARVGTVTVHPDFAALRNGRLSLARLSLVAPEIHVVREADGRFALALEPARPPEPAPSVTPNAAGQRQVLLSERDPAGADGGETLLDELLAGAARLADMRLALRDAVLVVEDRGTGRTSRVRVADLRTVRDGAALRLEASLGLGRGAAADLAVRLTPGDARASAMVVFADINPARDLAPRLGLPGLAGWDQTVAGHLTADLDLAVLTGAAPDTAGGPLAGVTFAHLVLEGGGGTLTLPAPLDHAYRIGALDVDAALSVAPSSAEDAWLAVDLTRARLDLDGVALEARGRVAGPLPGGDRTTAAVAGTVAVALTPMDVPTLVAHWPPAVADGARSWIAERLSGGRLGQSRVSLTLGGATWGDLDVTDLTGGGPIEDMTVRYLDGLPAATGAFGTLDLGLDTVTVTVDRGGVGALQVREGQAVFFDLDTGTELADLSFRIDGPLADALALIDHEPLGYARQVGIDPTQVTGHTDTHLTIAMPLLKDLPLEALDIGVEATGTGVGVPDVLLGQDLRDGAVRLALDGDGMDVTGTARLGGVPIRLDWREVFRDGGPFDRRYTVRGRLDDAARARFRLTGPPFQPPWLSGPVDATVTYTETAGQPSRLEADVDVAPAILAVDALGWRKDAGVPGRAAVTGSVSPEAIRVAFDVSTATGGQAVGRANLTGDAALISVDLDRVKLAGSTGSVSLRAPTSPGEAYAVRVRGETLDLRAALSGSSDTGADSSDAGADAETPGPPIALDADLARVRLTDTIALEPARATLHRDSGGTWRQGQLEGRIGGEAPVAVTVTPDGARRRVSVQADDAGAVAAALGLSDQMRGGRLRLSATLRPDGPTRGRLEVSDFKLAEAPVLARILAVASLTGILDELQGGGLTLSTLVAPFTYAESVLTLTDARTNGPSLGLTASGTVDLDADTLSLEGVVVPVYLVNALLGRIPVLGDLLVGEKGGGVFAVSYSARGRLDDPQVAVNPLSVLTPGVLRDLFAILPDARDGASGTVTMPSVGPSP